MDLHAENILDHYKHPRHSGSLDHPTVQHHEENLSCGDTLDLDLLIEDDAIKDIKWHGGGCAISQAGMSMLSEELLGMSVEDAESLTPEKIKELLGVPVGPRRIKCAFLCLHTLKNALRASRGEEPASWIHTVAVDEN